MTLSTFKATTALASTLLFAPAALAQSAPVGDAPALAAQEGEQAVTDTTASP